MGSELRCLESNVRSLAYIGCLWLLVWELKGRFSLISTVRGEGREVSLFGSKLNCGVLYYNITVLKRSNLSKDITLAIAPPHVTLISFAS